MARLIAGLLLVLSLVGCATTAPKPEIQYITAQCPPAPLIPRPPLATDSLTPQSDPGTIIQAHRLTIKDLQKWGLEQEAILNGYRKKQ